MDGFAELRIVGPLEARLDDIEYEAVRRLLGDCENDPSRVAKILKCSPQRVKAIISGHAIRLMEAMTRQ